MIWDFLGSKIALYFGLALLLSNAITLGVMEYRVISFQAELATARQQTAGAKEDAAKINLIFANNEADRERARAEDEKKSREESERLGREKAAAEARYRNEREARITEAANLRRIIDNANAADRRPIGPAMRAYFAGLRSLQQRANGAPVAGDRP